MKKDAVLEKHIWQRIAHTRTLDVTWAAHPPRAADARIRHRYTETTFIALNSQNPATYSQLQPISPDTLPRTPTNAHKLHSPTDTTLAHTH